MDGLNIDVAPSIERVRRDVEMLRESYPNIQPRVHGNGFIQLDLTPSWRLHVWGDYRIPRQKTPTPIHDHVFNFTSYVLRGRLINVTYQAAPYSVARKIKLPQLGNFYEPHTRMHGDRGEDTILHMRDPAMYGLFVKDTEIIRELEVYECEAGDLHESIAWEPCVTVIYKNGPTVAQGAGVRPRVFVPLGLEPSNDFNRYTAAPVGALWQIINDNLI